MNCWLNVIMQVVCGTKIYDIIEKKVVENDEVFMALGRLRKEMLQMKLDPISLIQDSNKRLSDWASISDKFGMNTSH